MTSTLAILTLNEMEAVKLLYDQIPFEKFNECFVVDGGSSDGTIEFFKEKGVRVILQDKPGHGEAYKCAVDHATGDIVVFFSGDGNERAGDIDLILEAIREGYDMVIASRFMKGSKSFDATPLRRFGNFFFTFLVNLRWGQRLTDVFNAFRAVKRKSFESLRIEARFFDAELEMVIKAIKKGLQIKEIPTVEMERIGGKAKLKTMRDGWSNFKRFLKEALDR